MRHIFADALILKTVFYLFIIIPTTLSHAQNMQARLVRVDYVNSSGENGSTFFDWDSGGTPELSLWALDNGSRYSLNILTYDVRKNLIEKRREYSDHKDTKQLYWYDAGNRLVREDFYLLDTLKGTTTFEYDGTGRLLRMNCDAYSGWIRGMIEFFHDAEGRKAGGTLWRNGQRLAEILYGYSERGNLMKEEWRFSGGWEQKFLYVYAVPDKKISFLIPAPSAGRETRRVEREYYQYGQTPRSPSVYWYRADGRLTEKIFTRLDGFSTITRYLYDAHGTPVCAYRTISGGKNALLRYIYNGEKKMISRTVMRNDGMRSEESFFYDGEGKMQSATLQNVDFWLTGTMSVETWMHGMPLSASFAAVKGPSATIAYRYDSADNVSEIEWTFVDGMRQIYWFEYQSK